MAGEPALGGGNQGGDEVALHAVHQRLRFRVAEADVELEHFGALGGHHQAGIQEAGELRPFDGREDDSVEDVAGLSTTQDTGVAIRAHAAGVRAGVAVINSFVVLSGSERNGIAAVAEGDEADLLAAEELLDDESALQGGERGLGFGAIVGDDDAFAGRQSIGFQNDGEAETVERAPRVSGIIDRDELARSGFRFVQRSSLRKSYCPRVGLHRRSVRRCGGRAPGSDRRCRRPGALPGPTTVRSGAERFGVVQREAGGDVRDSGIARRGEEFDAG